MYEDAFVGYPVTFKDICLIYPPLNKDIINVGYEKFSQYVGALLKSQEDVDDVYSSMTENKEAPPSPFMFLLMMSILSPEIKQLCVDSFFFFCHEKITFLYDIMAIAVGELADQRLINEENFFDFQNIVRMAIGEKAEEKPDPNEHPKIRRFKALQRQRDKIKAKNSAEQTKQFHTLLTSLCCMNMGINPLNIGDVSFAATKMLLARYTVKDAYESTFACQLAGGTTNTKNSYWIRDLEEY